MKIKIKKLWYKFKKNKIIPIVLATNEYMAPSCGVTIQSVIEHASQDHFYDIYILYSDLSEKVKTELENMKTVNLHVQLISVEKYVKNYILKLNPKLSHITKETYYRFFIPSILNFKKVIWLDSDLILQTDIAKLYNINLKNNLIAGVRDILTDEEEKDRTDFGLNPFNHVNAGVLLINNQLWQKEEIQKKIIDEIVHPHHEWTLNDQDIINFICRDRIFFLEYKWNFLYAAFRWNNEKYKLSVGSFDPKEYYIIHYNGSVKPWIFSETELERLWWKYASKTPFYEKIYLKLLIKENETNLKIQSVTMTILS